MKEICYHEIDFYILQSLMNDSRKSEDKLFREIRKDIPKLSINDFKKSMERVEGITKRYTAVTDPLINGMAPFYAFVNVRENFKSVTDSIRKNIGKVAGKKLIAVYDLIGKPDFILIGLAKGVKGRKAEEHTHDILSELGGEEIHNYLTTQVEIPRAIKKFWHADFNLFDFEERAKELSGVKYNAPLLKKLQQDCRKVIPSRIKTFEDLGIVKGYSVVIDTKNYPSSEWNFIKAFIQVDALYDKFQNLYGMLEREYPNEIRSLVEIPYTRYSIIVECVVANIARLRDIMGAIRNQDYVRTTSTAIARNVILEDMWVV